MKKVLIIFIVLISASSAFAQESNFGNWLIYIGSKKINSKLNLHHEIQQRNYNALGDLEQLLIIILMVYLEAWLTKMKIQSNV